MIFFEFKQYPVSTLQKTVLCLILGIFSKEYWVLGLGLGFWMVFYYRSYLCLIGLILGCLWSISPVTEVNKGDFLFGRVGSTKEKKLFLDKISLPKSYKRFPDKLILQNKEEFILGSWIKFRVVKAGKLKNYKQKIYIKDFAIIGQDNSPAGLLLKKRYQFIDFILQKFFRCKENGIIIALLTGVKDFLDWRTMKLFQSGGLTHLLVVSGLHVSLVAKFFTDFLRRLLALSYFSYYVNTKKIADFLGLILGLFYVLFSGSGSPSLRAWIMSFSPFLALLLGCNHYAVHSIFLAAGVLLLYDPNNLWRLDWQLSFLATCALNTLPKVKYPFILSSFWVNLLTLPTCLYFFKGFSFSGLFLNIVAIPLVSYFIMPLGSFAFFCYLWGWDVHVVWVLMYWFVTLLYRLAELGDSGFLRFNYFTKEYYFLAILGIGLFLLQRRLLGLGLLLGVLSFYFSRQILSKILGF